MYPFNVANKKRGKNFKNRTCLPMGLCSCRAIMMSTASAAAAKSLQSCPTLCNPIGSSPPGSPVPGIL